MVLQWGFVRVHVLQQVYVSVCECVLQRQHRQKHPPPLRAAHTTVTTVIARTALHPRAARTWP